MKPPRLKFPVLMIIVFGIFHGILLDIFFAGKCAKFKLIEYPGMLTGFSFPSLLNGYSNKLPFLNFIRKKVKMVAWVIAWNIECGLI
jgi:hypothetical protein